MHWELSLRQCFLLLLQSILQKKTASLQGGGNTHTYWMVQIHKNVSFFQKLNSPLRGQKDLLISFFENWPKKSLKRSKLHISVSKARFARLAWNWEFLMSYFHSADDYSAIQRALLTSRSPCCRKWIHAPCGLNFHRLLLETRPRRPRRRGRLRKKELNSVWLSTTKKSDAHNHVIFP